MSLFDSRRKLYAFIAGGNDLSMEEVTKYGEIFLNALLDLPPRQASDLIREPKAAQEAAKAVEETAPRKPGEANSEGKKPPATRTAKR